MQSPTHYSSSASASRFSFPDWTTNPADYSRMQPQIPGFLDCIPGTTYYLTGIVTTAILFAIWGFSDRPNLDKIPTVGSSTWLGSWWAGITFLFNATTVIQEGYTKYKGIPFKVSTFFGWMVILSGRQHVEEFRKSPDDEFNFLVAVGDSLKAEHTLGHDTHLDLSHFAILASRLSRNLGAIFDDIKDEIVTAFDDVLKLEGQEWKTCPTVTTVQQIVSRASNRAFVGLPLCRNPEWVDLNIQFAIGVIKGALTISLFPNFMAGFVTRFMTDIYRSNRRGMKHLAPIFEARRKHIEEYGASWDDEPNDLISWLMEESEGPQCNASNITSRVLAMNFAAIHTTSNTFTQALYNLAANPQYIQPLREEVESILKEESWSKTAIGKMHKIDSFMRETQRVGGVIMVNMVRRAMKDVTLSDGTVVPKGAFVVMAAQMMHRDSEYYEDPEVFDPFRFAKMRTGDDSADDRHQFTSVSPEYLAFGYGRHACPGRFFAQGVLNTMLAHVVISYDIKLEDNATRPNDLRIGIAIIASPTASIMLRKRVD